MAMVRKARAFPHFPMSPPSTGNVAINEYNSLHVPSRFIRSVQHNKELIPIEKDSNMLGVP